MIVKQIKDINYWMLRLSFCSGKDNNYTFEELKQELFMNDYSQVILFINNYLCTYKNNQNH